MRIKLCRAVAASVLFSSASLFSCKENKTGEGVAVFNEGMALSLQASNEADKGNLNAADSLNKLSIYRFREVLSLDSSHALVRSSLAHSLYLDSQFEEALKWYNAANRFGGATATNYREMGLCEVNLGWTDDARKNFTQAFALDTSREIREFTAEDVLYIGRMGVKDGDDITAGGDTVKGKGYYKFALRTLILSFEYHRAMATVNEIVDVSRKAGDEKAAAEYTELAKKNELL